MNFIEFLGFIISLAAMIFIFTKRYFEERSRERDPEAYAAKERRKEEALKKLYQTLELQTNKKMPAEMDDDDDDQEIEKTPIRLPVHRLVHTTKVLPKPTHKRPPSPEHAPKYQVNRSNRASRGGRLLESLPSQRDMLIIKEIFDKPLAMREPFDDTYPNDRK